MSNDVQNYAPPSPSDVVRSQRFDKGATLEEIATEDGLDVRIAELSVRRGHKVEVMRMAHRINKLKLKAQLDNEELRDKIRSRLGDKLLQAIESMLEGQQVIVSKDKETGAILTETITNPKIQAVGVEQFRKAVSLEEKPAPPQTIVNVQQNNSTPSASSEGLDFESRLRAIRQKQRETAIKGEPAIEAEAHEVRDEPSADRQEGPESDAEKPSEDTKWEDF